MQRISDTTLYLVFAEGIDEGFQNEAEVRHKLRASFFLQSCKSRARGLLDALVWVQNSLQKLNTQHTSHQCRNPMDPVAFSPNPKLDEFENGLTMEAGRKEL